MQKHFVNVLEERTERDDKTYSNKNEIELLRKDFEILRQEMKTGFAETKSELKTEINKLVIWIEWQLFWQVVRNCFFKNNFSLLNFE